MLHLNPTRVWDTFAEPNNKTIPSVAFNQNQASPRLVEASPKKQDNRRRLRLRAAQNLSSRGSETPLQIRWIFLLDRLVLYFYFNTPILRMFVFRTLNTITTLI